MLFPACYFVMPEQAFFMFPFDYINSCGSISDIQPKNIQQPSNKKEYEEKKMDLYFEIYKEQLIKMRQVCVKKCWTQKQDEYLLNLNPENIDWASISKQIPHTNPSICKRRYYRLQEQLVKWPTQLDASIRRLFQEQNLGWSEIRKIINQRFSKAFNIPKFSTNKIKQRYTLYLRPGISREQWTVNQDLQLIKLIKKNGKQWTRIIKNNSILEGRTQLQLKNRYFGTLKFLQKRVMRKVITLMKQQNKNTIQM